MREPLWSYWWPDLGSCQNATTFAAVLGISRLDPHNVKVWMLANLDRLNIYVPGDRPGVLSALEMYLRARVGSVFEGSA
jgi:hypothetical protein